MKIWFVYLVCLFVSIENYRADMTNPEVGQMKSLKNEKCAVAKTACCSLNLADF